MKQLDVTILLLNDCFVSTALAPIEVFHSAGRLWNELTNNTIAPRFRVTVASLDGLEVESPYSVRLSPEVSIESVKHANIIVVPASGVKLDAQFARHAALFPWLQSWHDRGAYIASICSGAAYLAEAGLLDGHEATTHWGTADAFMERYPRVKWRPDVLVTEDRRMLCSGGVYAAIDLSLYLVEKFCGHEIAVQTAKALLVDMPRTNQSGYAVLPLSKPHQDDKIREAELFIQKNFSRQMSIENLAERVNMSPRTFIRRFKEATGRLPGKYLQVFRISIAKEMLENGARSVQMVSSAVGYEDVAYFRALFKRLTGMAPAQYRAKFCGVRSTDGCATSES
ncbi:helix-turn-helix domain-containing protein [Marinobacter sp. NP-4(2019)]|uniref:GlxA family transcriptional regulator n=1 Tax=Marinobacter sp. NP-4(2019) TaxID=2488665 RepID=UPI000FC3E195|nr:helix-turn-helix domain-containing protein [Marinobacter sp. NP-4(2019)]AZT83615.1 helix-turn-helix domain-containing protein [Marinobacter sp. NP-4(2019)]